MDVSTFLGMGGHAAFVWPAYAVAAVVLIALLLVSVWGLKAARSELAALQGGEDGEGPVRSRGGRS